MIISKPNGTHARTHAHAYAPSGSNPVKPGRRTRRRTTFMVVTTVDTFFLGKR